MARYIVTDRVPCWVTWTYTVEADSEEAAIEAFYAGDYLDDGHGEPEIGDTIEFVDSVQGAKLADSGHNPANKHRWEETYEDRLDDLGESPDC